MIITRTPFRMSFFGGGTDMESFFRRYGGAVISTTFDKYCYVNVRHLPRFFTILRVTMAEPIICPSCKTPPRRPSDKPVPIQKDGILL
jgi:galactokinase/mevalonate kinase-like predicted kinase